MPLYQVVVLALVQAATEFLPISSSAHLIVVPWLFGWQDQGLLFDVALHLGTLAAVLLYFAKTWIRLLFLAAGRKVRPVSRDDPDSDLEDNPRLFAYLVAATFPAGIAGLLLEDYVKTIFRSPLVVAGMLIAVGLVIWWAERAGRLERNLGAVSLGDALTIGGAQALALIPGTSRSGITISAGLFRGLQRTAAARFSFLLSSPIILGASVKAGWGVWRHGGVGGEWPAPFLLGIVVSGVAGYAVIGSFLRYLQRSTMLPFVYYRVIFGIMIVVLASFFGLPPSGNP